MNMTTENRFLRERQAAAENRTSPGSCRPAAATGARVLPDLRWLCVALLSLMTVCSTRADSTVVFNEIMYHPATNEAQMEWVELHNQMAVDMDISGWSVANAVNYKFAEGTIVPGGGYLVIASSPGDLQSATGATNVLGP